MDAMNQAAQPAPTGTPSEQLVKYLCDNVAGSAMWMKLLGVLLIIYGILMVVTIVGILICWLPIWLGVMLFKAAGDAEAAHAGSPPQLLGFIQRINKFFLISGILALIWLVIALIFIFVAGVGGIFGMLSSMS